MDFWLCFVVTPEAGGIGRHKKIAGRDLYGEKDRVVVPVLRQVLVVPSPREWQCKWAGLGQFHGKSLSNDVVLIESTPNHRLKAFLFRDTSS